MIPLITLEEHFFSAQAATGKYVEQLKFLKGVEAKLMDLGSLRLQEMDKGAVTLQVISHAPGLATAPAQNCISANDQLFEAVKANPDRFAGFAVLPMSKPEAAAEELKRCIEKLGFVGALIDNHVDGKHFESEDFWPFWETAEKLDVPIYLHPTWPSDDMEKHYEGRFSEGAALSIGSSGFGWHADTHLHILKLFAAGIFDRFPRLKIIIGHMGEMLPFQLDRIEHLSKRWGERKRDFEEVYNKNIWITTSGVWSIDPMACILRNTKIDHILFSVDYPFARNEWGLSFMEKLETSGLVTAHELELIGYKNAESLLRIRASKHT